jgi:hypothetical protein
MQTCYGNSTGRLHPYADRITGYFVYGLEPPRRRGSSDPILEVRRDAVSNFKREQANRGAAMDYEEHEKNYDLFVKGVKYGTMHIVFVLIALAVGFFTPAGFIFSVLFFVVLSVGGVLLL